MNVDSDGEKGLRELNHRLYDGNKRTTNSVIPEEDVMLGADDLKVNKIAQNVKDGHVGAVQASAMWQMAQQQPQNAKCYWQRFLNLTTVTVLLVENDDSTRHVVTALLRNCCYDVIETANVLQAWKILEDLTNHIDLILAEVGIPSLSGLVLLSKIMSHKTRKNVRVIMMSSQDSMNLVFKCLSKGAVDFLVKPVRKNELKNLWQHVWRRCHSSSGSGSESGSQTQKSVRSKSVDKSDNDSGSNDVDDNGSGGENVGDGSDDGSGTQNSWTKQAVEVDSSRLVSPSDEIAECPDSTCAQVVHSNAEVPGNKGMPVAAARGCQERDEQLDKVAMGKDLGVNKPRDLNLLPKCPVEAPIRTVGTKQINLLEMSSSKYNDQIDKRKLDLNSEAPSCKEKSEAANQTGITSMTTDPKMEIAEYEASNRLCKISDGNDKTINDSAELPSIELGLKRLRGVKDAGTVARDERNVLRRSNASAFSRYNTAANANKVPAVNTGSLSTVDNNLEPARKGSVFVEKNKAVVLDEGNDVTTTAGPVQPRGTHQELKMQHSTNHYDQHSHLTHDMQQLQPEHDDLSLKKLADDAPHCGSSNMLGGLVEGNAGNYSVNGNASGSNPGSNGTNGSSNAVNTAGKNMEGDNGIAGKSGSGDASGFGSGSKADQSKSAHREAALTKFRQKRKERCFQKKVRYQSRKRLAEQRPRIKGQFVRRTLKNNELASESNSCSE
ncbi:two-component response regulator-like APRR7 isoform X2 [Hibiscus syriacus]|uniref:two-component response regulator-like APRR7 isoform X2 n=1 Tax=Hibiscus syriacus TaxID=106335 RepID=UPI0019206B35|nr:two-component response regulator-like APRR7 isoform X2 [Hibiscus syriacus]